MQPRAGESKMRDPDLSGGARAKRRERVQLADVPAHAEPPASNRRDPGETERVRSLGTGDRDADEGAEVHAVPEDEEAAQDPTIHPFAAAFPRMSDGEFKDLAKDIEANGLRHKIVRDREG